MSEPIRVLHLISQLGGGGSERWVWDLVRLSDPSVVRHRVVPLMLDRGDFVYADRLAEAGAYRHSITRPFLERLNRATGDVQSQATGAPGRRSLAGVWRGACYTRASFLLPATVMSYRPHILHAHTYEPLIAALALRKLFRTPVIHTVPALFSQMEEIGRDWLPRMYQRRHEEIGLFFTGASRSELLTAGVPAEKVRWIEGVVDVADVADAVSRREAHRAAVRSEIGAAGDAPLALSVGRLHQSKGHQHALRALPELLATHPDLHWIVLGAGPLAGELRQTARELGVAHRAHFLGFRPNPLPYYAASDIYFRTPVYEAENLCSYQAMAAGVAVVGFDTGIDTELLRKVGHGALVLNEDPFALAERAAEILSRPDRGRAMGERGAGYARSHLDIRRTIEDYTTGYLGLASPAGTPPLAARRDVS